jgi:outer membrane protein
MKKIHIIAEVILFLLVIVLFVLHFTAKSSHRSSGSGNTSSAASIDGGIAYVNLDTVVAKYKMTIELTAELQKKGQQFDAELSTKSKNFQSGVQDLQYKAQRGLEVRSKLEEMQQQLAAEEQNIYKLRDSYAQQLQEENSVMLRKVLNSIMDYMKVYTKDNNIQFILGNSFDGKILYANQTLDITQDVLNGLNEQYKPDKSKESKK